MGGTVGRVVDVHGAHHHIRARRCRCRADLHGFRVAHRKRLLTQHCQLAGLTRRDHLGRMHRVGAAHHDNIDARVLHDRIGIGREGRTTSCRDSFGDTDVDVHHADHMESVGNAGQHRKMNRLRHEARAKKPDTQRTAHESARRTNTIAILSLNEVLVTTNDSVPDASARTVMVAFAANLGVAFAKLVAAIVTRSTAMSAEAAHAFADSGNQVLLLVAQRRSRPRSDERHPFGHGREAYFWALIASVVVFVAGAVFSAREGISELVRPVEASSFVVAYVVLAISLLLDGVSLRQAVRQLRGEALMFRRDVLDQVMLTSDPTVRAVFRKMPQRSSAT